MERPGADASVFHACDDMLVDRYLIILHKHRYRGTLQCLCLCLLTCVCIHEPTCFFCGLHGDATRGIAYLLAIFYGADSVHDTAGAYTAPLALSPLAHALPMSNPLCALHEGPVLWPHRMYVV